MILSGRGDDNLQGGTGSDDIRGGLGDDTIYGGTGADIFVFANSTDLPTSRQFDTIVNFTSGQDVIALGAFMLGGVFIDSAESSGRSRGRL